MSAPPTGRDAETDADRSTEEKEKGMAKEKHSLRDGRNGTDNPRNAYKIVAELTKKDLH